MDREEHYTDLHMLRVTKTLQEFIKGGDMMEKNKKDLEKAEARAQHNKDAHARTMAKLQKQLRQLQKQIKEKEKENNRLRSSQVQLNDTVKVREQLHKTRIETQGGSTDPRLAARKRIQVRCSCFPPILCIATLLTPPACLLRYARPLPLGANSLTWQKPKLRRLLSSAMSLTACASALSQPLLLPVN